MCTQRSQLVKPSTVLQMYREVIEDFKDKAGLPEEAIRDVRGNHDAFDVPDRCGNLDFKLHGLLPMRSTQNRCILQSLGKHKHAKRAFAELPSSVIMQSEYGLK